MKKIIKWMMALAMGCALAMTIAAEAATEGNFNYSVSGGNATITGYVEKPTGELVIPDTLGGYPVTAIGGSAFSDCTSLKKITVPKSVTNIGNSAFKGCTSLEEITLPFVGMSRAASGKEGVFGAIFGYTFGYTSNSTSGTVQQYSEYVNQRYYYYYYYIPSTLRKVTITDVTHLQERAFYNCSMLTEININEEITDIGFGVFFGCTGLTSVTIPEGVTTIGGAAFSGCTGLTSVTIPNSVTSIGNYAFFGCTGLTAITIPDSVTSIGDGAFSGCKGLMGVTIPGSVTSMGGGSSITPNGGIFANCSRLTSVTILEGVTRIEYYAFYGCTSLTSVTIPESVTSIGNSAFSGCRTLAEITIPDSVTSIGTDAFSGCKTLAEITIPNSVTKIGSDAFFDTMLYNDESNWEDGALYKDNILLKLSGTFSGSYIVKEGTRLLANRVFYNCSSLTNVTISEGVTIIGDSAFSGCTGLTNVTIPDSVTSIGYYAFQNCTGLLNIAIPEGVTSVSAGTFEGCTSLVSVTIPSTVISIEWNAFNNCTGLKEVNISSIEAWCNIPDDAVVSDPFNYADTLLVNGEKITELIIPEGVTNIRKRAFRRCSNLTSVTIPDSVTLIEESAFSGCTGLTSVTIPESVTEIGERAFVGCKSLTSVTIPENVTEIGKSAFSGCTGLTNVTIPGSVTSISGCYYGSRGEGIFANCSNLTNVTILEGVTSIGNYAFYGCTGITKITIPESVESIGYYAFENYLNLEEVKLPYRYLNGLVSESAKTTLRKITLTSGTRIDSKALSGFTALEEVILPDELTEIGSKAFENCEKLSKINIPDSVTAIGNSAFSGCSALSKIDIPGIVMAVGESAFSGCSALSKIDIPGSVETIGESAFSGCTGLTEVTIAEGVANIGTSAFSGCSALSKISIPGSVTEIGNGAFADCGRLRTVTLADGLETVGKNAFKNCGMVRKLTIPDSVTEIGDGAFYGCNSLEEISVPFVGLTESSTGADAVFGAIFGRTQTGETEVTLQYPGYYYYIPNSLKKVTVTSAETLPEFAFRNCRRFTEINLTDGLLKIDSSAFESCDALSEITIPDSVTDIADYAFYDCGGLKTVTLGTGIKTIGTDAFSGCKAIETAVYPGSADEWAAVTVEDGNEDLTSKLARAYTYTFKNADGSVFATGVIPYGTEIPLPEGEPEKAGDEKYSYTFTGWAGYSEGMTIEGDITFEPEFEETLNRYTYRFISDGEVIKEETADYGTVIEAPETVPEGEFPLIFSEWEGFTEGMELSGSIDFNAVFINRSFTVTPEGGEAVTVVYGDEFVLGFTEEPGQLFIGYFTEADGGGEAVTDSKGASLKPFTFDGDIVVYPYYVENMLEKIALVGDGAVKSGSEAVYSVRFATANEVTELYLEIRYPESLEFEAVNVRDAVSAELVKTETADGFVTAVFRCVLSDEKAAFEVPATPFEIVFKVGATENFAIEILESTHMSGDEDFAFGEVFSPETMVKNVIPGDVTGDGEVNKMDALRLKKYLAGLDVEIDLAAADVNCDGEVNKMDALRLKKYLAGQDVKLGE